MIFEWIILVFNNHHRQDSLVFGLLLKLTRKTIYDKI